MKSISNLQGLIAGLLAYMMWGLFPIYWKLLKAASAIEILTHRIFWSLIFVALLIHLRSGWKKLKVVLYQRANLKRFTLTSLLIAANWLIYIWAVNAGRTLECSLGYFICPLVTVALGYIFLKERLRPWQLISLMLALFGVLYKTINFGSFPEVAVGLAVTFAFYGLLRKTAKVESTDGLFIETLVLAPFALFIIVSSQIQSKGIFLSPNHTLETWLLILSGIVTALPLLAFAYATRRLSMATIGIIQYLSPTLQFICAVFLFDEPFSNADLIAFSLIWAGLLLYSLEGYRTFKTAKLTT